MKVTGHICCGTADCDWGFALPDTSETRMNKCYAEFRQHCIERHGLGEADEEAEMFLDLMEGTLTLIKSSRAGAIKNV